MFWFLSHRLPLGFRAGIGGGLNSFSRAAPTTAVKGISFVYVIRGDHGLVKVGVTTNMDARLATLRTASPFKLTPSYALATDLDAYQIEAEVHRRLDRYRTAGEWFDCTDAMAEHVIENVANDFGVTVRTSDSASWKSLPAPAQKAVGSTWWIWAIAFCFTVWMINYVL